MQQFEINVNEIDYRTDEAFKILRSNIEFTDSRAKVIAITSALPKEGKSTVAFELAISFVKAGKRALVVDADLRRSSLEQYHKKGKIQYGLSNYLAGQTDYKGIICATDVKNLYTVFAGPMPANPSELLGREPFKVFLDTTKELFDVVIVDTPPIGAVIDAAVVSKNCDGVVVVMGSGSVNYKVARTVCNQLEIAGAKILGVVLNKVDFSKNSYQARYYVDYYGEVEIKEK